MSLKLLKLLPRQLRHALIRRQARINEGELIGLTVRVASTVDDYVGAARLVHDGYVAKGIAPAHPSGVRMTPFLALPSTIVFVAHQGERMVGTISLVVDSTLGLPLQRIYGQEVDDVRTERRRIAEVGSLCIAKGFRGLGVAYLLNKAMSVCAAKLLGVDDLLIAVHPDAADLYEATLCFEQIGGLKQYPSLNRSAKAVALRLRLRESHDTWLREFGHRPADTCNTHYLYAVRVDPQIQLPPSAPDLRALAQVHRAATMKLAALRPDVLTELCAADFDHLRSELREPALEAA